MRGWGALIAVAGVAAAFASFSAPERPWTLVVSGDTEGYLSPCGCTSPMTGGIRRRATAVRQLAARAQVVLLDTGNLTDGQGRQSEMKAETMAQSLASMDATAVSLTAGDVQLGQGTVSAMARLADGRFVASDLATGQIEGVKPFAERGPFLIGSVSPKLGEALQVPATAQDRSITSLVDAANEQGKQSVLMLDASRDAAVDIARRFPSLAVVVYRKNGWPSETAERVGKVWLVTPGEHGKAIVRLTFDGKGLGGYAVTRLGPQFSDDPNVARLYRTYLRRVDAADLLSQVPRAPSDPFAGSEACLKCHSGAYKVWHSSAHAHALKTLEERGQGRDPDCVPCHVTGLTREGGFTTRSETPQFAFVGCESCHGPSAAHAANPKAVHLPKLGQRICMTCHTPDQSPRFQFLTYWQKIAHKQ